MEKRSIEIESCELCLIGVGIAGLNALHSSSQYLSNKDKIIVVDRRAAKNAVGGMWNDIYEFVQLHQPHGSFTVGNKEWKWNKDPSHLAYRDEVKQHLESCYNELKSNLCITEKFGYEYQNYKEVAVDGGYEVHITFKAIDANSPPLIVKAKRCIKAFGFDILLNEPIKFSTDKVQSIIPETPALLNGEVANDDKPIYIIGGGKTSMDVAGFLMNQNPKRKLNFVVGKGSFFLNRDVIYPTGLKRNWKGTVMTKILLDIVLHYDEHNLDAATEYIKQTYCLEPFENARHTLLGALSPKEAEIVKKATNTTVYDYLEDVKEENGEVVLIYKSGQKQTIEAGSWLINCSGYLFPKEKIAEPILSPHGRVLSIQKTTSAFIFTTFSGYFLPHLWFRDQFKNVPIRQFNHFKLIKKDKQLFLFGIVAQAIHNLIYFTDALPFKVVNDCGLNFDKWYPLHRQLAVVLDLLINKKKYLAHTSKILEQINAKYDVENGVIGQ